MSTSRSFWCAKRRSALMRSTSSKLASRPPSPRFAPPSLSLTPTDALYQSSKASATRRKRTTKPTSTDSPLRSKLTNAASTPFSADGSSSGTACGRRCCFSGARRACFRVRSKSLRGRRGRLRRGWELAGRGWGRRWELRGERVLCRFFCICKRYSSHAATESAMRRGSTAEARASHELRRPSKCLVKGLNYAVPVQPPGKKDGEQ